MKMKKKEGY